MWARRLRRLVAQPLASPLVLDVPQRLQHNVIVARPFGRALFLCKRNVRLRRLVAWPFAFRLLF